MNNSSRESIRGHLLAKRRQIDEQTQRAESHAVASLIVNHLTKTLPAAPHARDSGHVQRTVAAYRPLGGEIDPTPAARLLAAQGWRVVLPRCAEEGHMDFCEWQPGDSLREGAYGIAEPTTPPIEINLISAVIVPGVGFDRSGNRIGHGVGFYDRFFARSAQHEYAPYRLGLAYDFQIVDLPAPEPWDVPVQCVITPSELIGT